MLYNIAMLKKVLVVGGAGYIGGAVTDRLLEKKISFTVYDNLTYENHYLKPVNFIYGDVRDHKKLKKLLPEYSHVIWLAAIVGDGACAIKPLITQEVNQDSVEWVWEDYDGRNTFTSTCSVYGIHNKPVTEESPTKPLSVYAQTKLAAEKFLTNKNALIFRLGTAFGISDNYSRIRMDLAVNYMTMNAIKYKKLTVFGGKQWRPFVHVKDIGEIIVSNLEKKHTGIFNVAPQNAQIMTLAKKIKKETNCDVVVSSEDLHDDRNYFADVTKGLQAKVFPKETAYPISYGITEIKKLVLSNRIKNLDLEYYSNEKYLLQSMTHYENSFIKEELII